MAPANTNTDVTYTPAVPGALPIEFVYYEREVGASLEFTQIIDGAAVLVNDPNDMRALRVVSSGCLLSLAEKPGDPPALPRSRARGEAWQRRADAPVGAHSRPRLDNRRPKFTGERTVSAGVERVVHVEWPADVEWMGITGSDVSYPSQP